VSKQKRERIGPFVITHAADLNPEGIDCAMCGKLLARCDPSTDVLTPSCEEILSAGAVPIPNFGWFCSQQCADDYEREFGIKFQRNEEGRVEYYPEGWS
jgi:hypothetical protein